MLDTPKISAVAETVRRNDKDRFTTGLFAPPARREALFALYALNAEVAKIPDMVSENIMGQIRLEWWRESVEGIGTDQQRPHEVVQALGVLLAQTPVSKSDLFTLVEARAADLDRVQPCNLQALEHYLKRTASTLCRLGITALTARHPAADGAAEAAGLAYGLIGVLRSLVYHARAKRIMLPKQEAERVGLAASDVLELRGSEALCDLAKQIAEQAERHLKTARDHRKHVPKAAIAALLPASLAGQYLGHLKKAGYNPFNAEFGLARLSIPKLTIRALTGRY